MIPKKLTFRQSHQALINELNKALNDFRAIHYDETFLNDNAPEYEQAVNRVREISSDIFKLKNAWMTAVAIIEVKAEEERQRRLAGKVK